MWFAGSAEGSGERLNTLVIGTAGHIDHGKTTLVRALTGVHTDRLEEEKRRGISIELGFAAWQLSDTLRASIVDVPGHERLVRTMVAGAMGLDMVMLVVAADDGVMPQTKEHLDILELLGVPCGVVVVSKVDKLVDDPEMLALAEEEIAEALQGTFLENAPRVRVSSTANTGMKALRHTVTELAAQTTRRPGTGPGFLPIDRVFHKPGFGLVATGTMLQGRVHVGDTVEAFDARRARTSEYRVRGVQVQGEGRAFACAGMRTAINLGGKEALRPDQVLGSAGAFLQSRHVIVEVRVLKGAASIGDKRLSLHVGTTEREVEPIVLGVEKTLAGGEQGYVLLRATEAVVCFAGQHFVLRRPGAHGQGTVAGGQVIDPLAPSGRGSIERARAIVSTDDQQARMVYMVLARRGRGISAHALIQRTVPEGREMHIEHALKSGSLLAVPQGKTRYFVAAAWLQHIEQRLHAAIMEQHDRDPLSPGLAESAAQSGLPPPERWLAETVLEHMLKKGTLVRDGAVLGVPGRGTAVNAADRQQLDDVMTLIQDANRQPPLDKVIADKLSVDQKRLATLLNVLRQQHRLLRVSSGLHYPPAVLNAMQNDIVTALSADENQSMSASELKVVLGGLSRKFTIPLLEYFDKQRVTLRQGDKRRLHPLFSSKAMPTRVEEPEPI